ncbi:hypothetical protein KKF29_01010 [Patescibacteria group bacterium]|nr:hypothetical protein [Patescibacteria group bacterium]
MFKKVIILGTIFALFVLLSASSAQAIVIKDYKWNQVSADGFGDWNNAKVEKLSVFDKKLYVSTYNDTTGVEIWRTSDGSNWNQVNTDGFGDSNNEYASTATVFNNKLYIATYNSKTGTELWYTKTGNSWKQKNRDGFSDKDNVSTSVLQPFKSRLYAFAERDDNEQTNVFRAKYPKKSTWKSVGEAGLISGTQGISKPVISTRLNKEMYVAGENNSFIYKTANGKTWEIVNSEETDDSGWGVTGNTGILSMVVKNNKLFAGTENPTKGAQLWVYDNGVWTQKGGAGLGDPENEAITTLIVKKGKGGKKYLFASLANDNGLKIFRTRGGSKWFQMNAEDGFGNTNNTYPLDMYNFAKMLFVTVDDAVWATNFTKN